jgi:ribokinase
MKRILVLGSLNVDFVTRIPHIPHAGETLQGGDLQVFAGGKGANQACAASLLGGTVMMAGKLGDDLFADKLTAELKISGVSTELVQRSDSPSGTAIIFVLPHGDNLIVISPGANADVSTDFALKAVEGMKAGDLLLCQLEVPRESVQVALASARKKRVITLLDPAPASALSDELLSRVDILTPNQTEAALLLGDSEPAEDYVHAEMAARKLQARGPGTVIVKMGARGCLVADGDDVFVRRGFQVQATDTTGAGDTFNGALAAALAAGETLADASLFANAAAALSVAKPGAIASIPRLTEVQEFLASQVTGTSTAPKFN